MSGIRDYFSGGSSTASQNLEHGVVGDLIFRLKDGPFSSKRAA
jgi:hypothetical protein